MLGNLEGTPEQKLQQVEQLVSTLVPHVSCRLSNDETRILCEATAPDGELHVEELPAALLPAECVRHAAMRLGKCTHPADRISDWERWASAWHVIQNHGAHALAYAEERIASLEAEGARSGASLWKDVRHRIAVLQASPSAWAGRA